MRWIHGWKKQRHAWDLKTMKKVKVKATTFELSWENEGFANGWSRSCRCWSTSPPEWAHPTPSPTHQRYRNSDTVSSSMHSFDNVSVMTNHVDDEEEGEGEEEEEKERKEAWYCELFLASRSSIFLVLNNSISVIFQPWIIKEFKKNVKDNMWIIN